MEPVSSRTCCLASQEHLWRKMSWYACRKKLLVIPFADLQTAQCPEMQEMKACEDPPIAKIRIGKDLWEELVNQAIQIECVHTAFLS